MSCSCARQTVLMLISLNDKLGGSFESAVAYDIQHIKELYCGSDDTVVTGKKAVIGALTLYLDGVNLFLTLLRLRRWGFAQGATIAARSRPRTNIMFRVNPPCRVIHARTEAG
jgi:hypothetical protein